MKKKMNEIHCGPAQVARVGVRIMGAGSKFKSPSRAEKVENITSQVTGYIIDQVTI